MQGVAKHVCFVQRSTESYHCYTFVTSLMCKFWFLSTRLPLHILLRTEEFFSRKVDAWHVPIICVTRGCSMSLTTPHPSIALVADLPFPTSPYVIHLETELQCTRRRFSIRQPLGKVSRSSLRQRQRHGRLSKFLFQLPLKRRLPCLGFRLELEVFALFPELFERRDESERSRRETFQGEGGGGSPCFQSSRTSPP